MGQKVNGGMPDSLDLVSAWTVQFAAVNPTTGAAVTGVNVSNAAIIAAQLEGTLEQLAVPSLWIPIPLDTLNTATGG